MKKAFYYLTITFSTLVPSEFDQFASKSPDLRPSSVKNLLEKMAIRPREIKDLGFEILNSLIEHRIEQVLSSNEFKAASKDIFTPEFLKNILQDQEYLMNHISIHGDDLTDVILKPILPYQLGYLALRSSTSWYIRNKGSHAIRFAVDTAPTEMVHRLDPVLTKNDIVDISTASIDAAVLQIFNDKSIMPKHIASSVAKAAAATYVYNKMKSGINSINEKLNLVDPKSKTYQVLTSLGKPGLCFLANKLVAQTVKSMHPLGK